MTKVVLHPSKRSRERNRNLVVIATIAITAAVWILNLITPSLASNDDVAIHSKDSYDRARWDPIHNKPAIDEANDKQCLSCHQEILQHKPRTKSPAGLKSKDVLAWYQTLDTYNGDQQSFHWRHLSSPYAVKVMDLSCNFCHQGNDLREESPPVTVNEDAFPPFTLRKMVNPSQTCLRCHGDFPFEIMDGLEGPWHQVRQDMESEDMPNGCLSCHDTEYGFRSVRHNVNYLKAAAIEEAALKSSDVCYGCHGGRAWYRISYPYPRHAWPDMPEDTPDWAAARPSESEQRFLTNPSNKQTTQGD